MKSSQAFSLMLALLSLTSFSAVSCATKPAADPESWFTCKAEKDCALLSGSSCTPPVAINLQFVGLYNKKHEKEPVCGPNAPGRTVSYSTCQQKRCVVKHKPISGF